MKTLFIATDFSEAARNAAFYGIELAKAFNARVILFNAYGQVPVPQTESTVLTLEEMGVRTERVLENEKQVLTAGNNVPVEIMAMQGIPASLILQAANKTNADLIIAGMKKSGEALSRFFGSTVTTLVKRTIVPLLVVPEDTSFTSLSAIALANESDVAPDTNPRLLDSLREIGERFHSKLFLVRIAKNRFAEAWQVLDRPFKISRMVRTLDPVYECIEGKDIPKALNDFIAGYNINLLALLPHKHALLEKWFNKSTTRSMVFSSHIPLLILPDLPAPVIRSDTSIKEESW